MFDKKASLISRRHALGTGLVALSVGVWPGKSLAAGNAIRFGAPLPLTGALAPDALKQRQGLDLWAETVNKGGGIVVAGTKYSVEIVYVDYQSNTARAVQATEQLIVQAKVNFLFAPFGSGAAKAASTVAERYELPMVAATASSSQVYDQGYKYLFGTFTPNSTLIEPLVELVVRKVPHIQRVAIIARNDLFPLALAQEMESAAKTAGLEILLSEKYAIGTMDHASVLSQIRALAPQWVFATGYINDLVLIRKQMVDQGVEAPVVTMISGPAYKEFVRSVGSTAAENVTTAAWWHPAVRYRGSDIFGTTEHYTGAFTAKFGSEPDYSHASSSAAGVVFQKAIEAAGTLTPDAIRDALAGMDLTTFYGPIKFGANGQIIGLVPPVLQIQEGHAVAVAPDAIRQSELRIGG